MSFHVNAEDIHLDDDNNLVARLPDAEGEHQDASINLNEILGNNEGSFEWGGVNFADSAEEISFSLEGDEEVPILRAKLANSEGELMDADVNLSERIANDNGAFAFA